MTADNQLIALSAGGSDKELASHGVGIEHIEELMVRVTMRLLREGHRIAYGGTIGIPGQSLTETLIQATQSWQSEEIAKTSDINMPATWPLVNYAAWPFYKNVTNETRANLVGICQFIDIDPPAIPQATLDQLRQVESEQKERARLSPESRLNAARGLTEMRRISSLETNLRIVWGGKIFGSAGWLPGILEEVSFSLLGGRPVLILGGFGGCSAIIAKYLLDIRAAWPAELSPASCADPQRDQLVTEAEARQLRERFEETQRLFSDYRNQIHGGGELDGTPVDQLVEALTSESTRRVIEIAQGMASRR